MKQNKLQDNKYKTTVMEQQTNTNKGGNQAFSEIFNCNKMKSLISANKSESFSDRFRSWLKAYTKESREKIWMDIESYNAG